MDNKTKDAICLAAKEHIEQLGLKQADLARLSGVNPSYLSVALGGAYKYQTTTFSDKFYRQVAAAVKYPLSQCYWPHADTDQYVAIIDKTVEAREYRYLNTLIGETGCGKSYTTSVYAAKCPINTYVVTINGMDDNQSILLELGRKIGVDLKDVRRGMRLRRLVAEIEKKAAKKGEPDILIVFDEAENTKLPAFGIYKSLYDYLVATKICGMILLGTPELLRKLTRLETRNKPGIAQFCRRIKAGITHLTPVTLDFGGLLESTVSDVRLRMRLKGICSNYGDLHDYLERALRIADQNGEELTNDYFGVIYNIVEK